MKRDFDLHLKKFEKLAASMNTLHDMCDRLNMIELDKLVTPQRLDDKIKVAGLDVQQNVQKS